MENDTSDKPVQLRAPQRQSTVADKEGDQNKKDASIQVSHERRTFLKQAGAFSAGIVSGPVLLPGGGSSGEAQAAVAGIADGISPAAGSLPVLQFNAPDPSHLLSVDLRSEANLLALNTLYGPGTYIPNGNLTFDPHRGVQANDESSGLQINLSKILDANVRRGLAVEGQVTVEFESQRIADPWLISTYLDRYPASRADPRLWPASSGLPPFAQQLDVWRMVAEDGVGGPSLRGPSPESPVTLGTRANNLSIRLRDSSVQDMTIGIHSAVHDEFTAITTAWSVSNSFTAYIDGAPAFLAGPTAVGPYNVLVGQGAYTMRDVQASTSPKRLLRMFFGRSNVYIRRLIVGARAPVLPIHPLFRNCASYGDSFTHRGGYPNSRFPSNDLWDASSIYYNVRKLGKFGYRMGYCWNNSLGGGNFLKTASRSLWNNNGQGDLENLKNINPSFVMMAASHNDAGYIGQGGAVGTAEYQSRLAQIKADLLEHVEVILTGKSATWTKNQLPGDAKIGIISVPASPRGPGWGENQAQAQRDLNAFVLQGLPIRVLTGLGEPYYRRIATFDAASLFGPEHLVSYHPLFERNGIGVHPNWWGSALLDFGWWQCALKLINN